MKILVVDDEQEIRELICFSLGKEGFETVTAENATTAIGLSRTQDVDLILLDLMLPDMSGRDVCSLLKLDEKTKHIPIIMVTAKTQESDIIKGFDIGADDYITKPFSPKVLVARVKSLARRMQEQKESEKESSKNSLIKTKDIIIDTQKHTVTIGDKSLDFKKTEFDILCLLAKNIGMAFSREKIISCIKGSDYPVTPRAVDVQILSIRKKLSSLLKKDLIQTLHGIGYRFCD